MTVRAGATGIEDGDEPPLNRSGSGLFAFPLLKRILMIR
jgi:hypothetical protein